MIAKAGERRHLTVVFCDLVGSTFLAEELDPEELRDVVRAYQQVCANVVSRFDGHIAQYLGDGVLIYFGFPNAHEEDPVRAVHAGLAIVQAMSDFEYLRSDGRVRHLSVRLGIHTGLVVAGEMGTGDRPEVLALGSTPNVAARLQTVAPQNAVVVSAETRRLTDGYFEFEELSTRAQAGSQSITGFRVLRQSLLQTPFELAVARGLTPFQNREETIRILGEHWLRATKGEGGLAFVSGEPGIGKSRLVHQLQAMVLADGGRWIVGRGSSFKQDAAFWPLGDALRQLVGGPSDPADEDWTPLLEERLAELEIVGGARLSQLAGLLRVALSPSLSSDLAQDAQRGRQETLETALKLLVHAARRQPLAVCFEDLHWLDPSTLEFLSELATRLESARLLVVLTARPSFQHSWPESAQLCSLSLAPLKEREVQAIVKHICNESSLPAGVIGQIVARTDGVPLFVEELTKSVLESEPRLEGSPPLAAGTNIPATLQDSLMARLDRLALGKRVAQLGAVLGREFDVTLMSSLGLFERPALEQGIEQLLAADLLRPVDGSNLQSYAFKHALIQDVAYESLLRSDRREYHKRIAETLIDQFSETSDRQPELVAHHLTEAALSDRALAYWLRAARRSVDRGANAEAYRYLERARAGAERMPADPVRWERELQIEMLGAQVARATAGYASREMEDSYTRALELCQRLGDAATGAIGTQMLVARVRCGEDFLTRSMAQNPRIGNRLFWIMWGFGAYHQSRAELPRALDIGNQLVELAGSEPALALEGHFGAGSTCYFMGRMPEAREHLERGWQCFETLHRVAETSPTGHHAEVLCAGYLALCLWHLGLTSEADFQMQLAIDVARGAKHTYSVAYALTVAAWLAQMNGDRERAAERSAEAKALAEQFGFGFALSWVSPISLWLEGTGAGDAGDCVERFRKHLERYRQSGYRAALTYFLGLLADVLITAGRLSEAAAVIDEALDAAEAGGERFWQPELYRLRAEIARAPQISNLLVARQSSVAASELAKRLNLSALEHRAAMTLAKLDQT